MGNACCSQNQNDPEGAATNKRIEEKLSSDHKRASSIHKMLLLGAGESGKSTLFKQMNLIYGKNPFPEDERIEYTRVVYANIIESISQLITMAEVYAKDLLPFEKKDRPIVEEILNLDSTEDEIDSRLAEEIEQIWNLKAIQKTYGFRSKYYLTDSAAYYFNIIHEIGKKGYIPTPDHILRCRARTTGVVEKTFEIKGNTFAIFDVGGQRNERKKWIHCFQDVTCVIFVAAISAYDTVLFEDTKQNRLVEALELFDEICNSNWFEKTTMILLLNKRDIFEDKVTTVPLSECPALVEYDGPMEYDSCADFIQQIFFEVPLNQFITFDVSLTLYD